MDLLHVFITFLFMILVGISHAAEISSPEGYWNLVLPTTPIPKSIKFLLNSKVKSRKTIYALDGPTFIGYGNEVGDNEVFIGYGNEVGDNEVHYNPNVTIFFLEKDLKTGKKMNTLFTNTNDATFLPRKVADSIPFSSNKLPEILNKLSVKPESKDANYIKKTIEQCESPGIKGEEKYCATSLESMIDFATSKLGTRVNAVSTEVEYHDVDEYAITRVQLVSDHKATVVCHKQNYVYAVFYCHKTDNVRGYYVTLRSSGKLGNQIVKTLATCHTDTSAWNPKHLAFRVLKVKPGTVSVCHFLSNDGVFWIPY